MTYPFCSYAYYQETYGGSVVPEDDWKQAATRASLYLEQALNKPITDAIVALDKVKLAVCAIAEIDYSSGGTSAGLIASESVGPHSVSYANSGRASASSQKAAMLCLYLEGTDLIGGALR